jgi:hypothetical protein
MHSISSGFHTLYWFIVIFQDIEHLSSTPIPQKSKHIRQVKFVPELLSPVIQRLQNKMDMEQSPTQKRTWNYVLGMWVCQHTVQDMFPLESTPT